MKHIVKSDGPPDFLEDWLREKSEQLASKSGNEQWKMFKRKQKQRLQAFLVQEQGYICAYCNREIHPGTPEDDEQSRIDHLQPKSRFPEQTFNYQNLVSSCHGNEREPKPREMHCDAQKKEDELPEILFPTNSRCEYQYNVSDEGFIRTIDQTMQNAIEETLNLNCAKLRILRKNVLAPFADGNLQASEANAMIRAYSNADKNGRFEPFCGIIINFLRQYSE